jgi:hypothetical protein
MDARRDTPDLDTVDWSAVHCVNSSRISDALTLQELIDMLTLDPDSDSPLWDLYRSSRLATLQETWLDEQAA